MGISAKTVGHHISAALARLRQQLAPLVAGAGVAPAAAADQRSADAVRLSRSAAGGPTAEPPITSWDSGVKKPHCENGRLILPARFLNQVLTRCSTTASRAG